MLINELAKAVHENAVAHGWWDDEREAPEIIALIHSEWSEALEEARADRPLAYIITDVSLAPQIETHNVIIKRGADGRYMLNGKEYHGKPEGVAVELIDGCIRILDYFGEMDANIQEGDGSQSTLECLYSDANVEKVPNDVAHLVAYLHLYTSQAMANSTVLIQVDIFGLLSALAAALSWVKKQGLDPLAILLEKHEFNKSRPYKHGKKF